MIARMGYVLQWSISTTVKSTSVPTGRKRREDLRAGTAFGQNGTQKSWDKFKPCEISEKPLFLCCYLYQWVMYSTAYRVRHRMKVFASSQKAVWNSEKRYCPYEQSIITEIPNGKQILCFCHEALYGIRCLISVVRLWLNLLWKI